MRVHPTGVALGDRLYVVGGTGAQGVCSTRSSAQRWARTGCRALFEESRRCRRPAATIASLVVGDHILVVGGFTTDQVPAPEVLLILSTTHPARSSAGKSSAPSPIRPGRRR
ncbi:MAG: hypothetical protein R3F43_29740 [bacterium]